MRNYNTLIGRYPGADGMKTGFICASGFNLVASATRNGRRLIAVVLGAPSSPVRAVKAAQLLERGFNTGALSWLTPQLGTVESLVPISAEPPNLREEMCGKHRKRPAAEEADEQDDTQVNATQTDSGSPRAINLSALQSIAKPSTLLQAYNPTTEPVVVFVGPNKNAPATQLAGAQQKPKGIAVAAAGPDAVIPAAPAAPAPASPRSLTTPAFAATAPAYPTPSAFTRALPATTPVKLVAVPLPRPRPKPGAPVAR